jgi:chromosome condensin MukBEF MukE localization factor
MKRIPKYCFYDKKGGWLIRRSNMSELKLLILKTLCKLDRDGVRATAYDAKLMDRYYDTAIIAERIHGDTVFPDGKLKTSTRASLNRALQAMLLDGYVDRTGSRYFGPRSLKLGTGIREHQRNHWRIVAEGRKVVAAAYNGELRTYLVNNRYVGENGAFALSSTVRVLNDGRIG